MLLEGPNLGAVVNMAGTISLVTSGNFNNLDKFLMRMTKFTAKSVLDKYGKMGVEALSAATPVRTGKTAASWSYRIEGGNGAWKIVWYNSNVNNGVNIAIILQEGHGTGTGGYVQGRDYINPALQSVFDKFAEELWAEVTK